MRLEKKLIIILFLFFLGIPKSHGDSVSKYRFYDTYRKMKAEKELDWRIRQNRVENLRLEFEATHGKFNPHRQDYINYLNRTEKDYRGLLSKEEEIMSAPYLSFEDRRNISKSYQSQIREVTDYYGKLRRNYYDYQNKSVLRRMISFPVGAAVTVLTAGQAMPTLLVLQSGKFGLDGFISTKFGSEVPGPWRAISLMYDSGFSLYGAHLGFQNASALADNGQKFLASIERIQAHYTAWQPFFNEYSRDHPDSFIGRGLPGIMAGLNLSSNIVSTTNVPEGRYLSRSFWKYPESVFRIGSAINDMVTIDYAIRGKDSWAANHPDSSFYLQQGCRLTDATQTVIATHLGTKEFNKAAELKLAQAYEAASKIGEKPLIDRVGNNEVITKSLSCQEVRSYYIDSPRKVPSKILKNPYQFAKLRYERAGSFLQEYVSRAGADNPKAAIANPFLFTYEGPSSYSNYEDCSSYLNTISLNNRNETSNCKQNNSYSLTNLYAEAPTNYTFPGGNFSVCTTNDSVTYRDYLDKGVNSKLILGRFGEFKHGVIWTDEKFKLGRANHSESFSLDFGNKFANADPKAFKLIEGLKVVGPDGEIWEVDMVGGPRNIDGTFSNGKSQGFWSGGLDRHGQILPTGSGVLVDAKHQNYYTQLGKGFAPQRLDLTNNFTSDWQGNYLFNQLNQPSRNFFKDFGSPFLEDFTPQTIAQKYDPWLQNYTVYGGGVEQLQDASGRYQTVNRLGERIALLGRDYTTGGPGYAKPETVRGGNRLGEVYERRLTGDELRVANLGKDHAMVMRPRDNKTRNILNDNYALYRGEYREGNWEKVNEYNVRKDIGERERFFERSQRDFERANRNTDIFKREDILAKRMVLADVINYNKSIGNLDMAIGRQSRVIEGRKEEQDIVRGLDFSNNPNRNIYPSLTSEAIGREVRLKGVYSMDRENVLGVKDSARTIIGEVTGLTYREDIWKHKTLIASESTKLTDALRGLRENNYIDSREYDFLGMNLRKNMEQIGFSRSAIPQAVRLFQKGDIVDRVVIVTCSNSSSLLSNRDGIPFSNLVNPYYFKSKLNLFYENTKSYQNWHVDVGYSGSAIGFFGPGLTGGLKIDPSGIYGYYGFGLGFGSGFSATFDPFSSPKSGVAVNGLLRGGWLVAGLPVGAKAGVVLNQNGNLSLKWGVGAGWGLGGSITSINTLTIREWGDSEHGN